MPLIIKNNGIKEEFKSEKLFGSLIRAGAGKEEAMAVIDHIEGELVDGFSTSKIYNHAFNILKKSRNSVAIKYSIRKAVNKLGPTGFPFEKFISEIYKTRGYNTKTGQIVYGKCVPHEVDVVAYNQKELIFIEAKFHNEEGYKSDLKTILYVKSRFDDLKVGTHDQFDGSKRVMTQGILITNTKFTETAIKYGECQGVKMIGWNYPEEDNLHDMIVKSNLQPITLLTSLTHYDIDSLLNLGIIICRDIDREILEKIKVKEENIIKILAEIEVACTCPQDL